MRPSSKLSKALLSTVAASAVVLTAAVPSAVAARPKPSGSAAGPACTVSAPASPSWLDIRGSGVTPGVLYQVLVAGPGGTSMGDIFYANQDGTFDRTNLPADYAGAYTVTLSKFHGGTVTSCSTTVN